MMPTGAPRRRATDHHVHTEYWTEADQYRFEDRISREIHGLREEVRGIAARLTMMLGALALLAFLLPLIAPFIRGLFNLP